MKEAQAACKAYRAALKEHLVPDLGDVTPLQGRPGIRWYKGDQVWIGRWCVSIPAADLAALVRGYGGKA